MYQEEHEIFRRGFRKFIEAELIPHLNEWEENQEIPRSVWKRFGELGFLCPWLDEKYGGVGADFLYEVIIDTELAKAGIGIAMSLHSGIVAPYINSFGTEEQKEKWLPGCTTGDTLLAVAMTEPNAGSDLQAIKTTAIKDGDEYVLNGQKTFITNGVDADLFIVACRTDPKAMPPGKGMSLIIVEDGTPGFIKGQKLKKMGLHTHGTSELYFENCRVPVGNLLGQEGKGFNYMMQKLQQERLLSCIEAQSLAERILEDASDYAKTRHAFGKPIGDFQYNAFKIAEMATEVEIGRTFVDSLIADHIQGKDIVIKVSMAKLWTTEMVNRIAYHCLQLYGGYGYMEEYPISRFYRNARVMTIYAGTSEIMKTIIARNLGFKS